MYFGVLALEQDMKRSELDMAGCDLRNFAKHIECDPEEILAEIEGKLISEEDASRLREWLEKYSH